MRSSHAKWTSFKISLVSWALLPGFVSVCGKLRVGIWHDYMIELFMLVNAPLRLQLRLQHPQTTPPKQLSLLSFLALVTSWTKLNTILPRELIFV